MGKAACSWLSIPIQMCVSHGVLRWPLCGVLAAISTMCLLISDLPIVIDRINAMALGPP